MRRIIISGLGGEDPAGRVRRPLHEKARHELLRGFATTRTLEVIIITIDPRPSRFQQNGSTGLVQSM